MTRTAKRRLIIAASVTLALLIVALGTVLAVKEMTRVRYSSDFGFEDLKSSLDADSDGVDDYTDIKDGALAYIATDPVYGSKYYAGGYPDDGQGVCTDVIWNAFAAAGYDLKSLVDRDIAENPDAYPEIKKPDPNIDFRRVRNLRIFFERNAESLPLDFKNPSDWQPGDIVVFEGHIGICSDKRNFRGVPYLIHHGNIVSGAVEADEMRYFTVVGHYRWHPGNEDQ
ncbi:MAG: DUF1287 domain-containing protein [Eubacteriales bacterium]